MRRELYSVAVFVNFYCGCFGADILAIIPTASFSHQIPFRPLWRELAGRGHNITLVTTDPMGDPNLKNVKEIDISYGYKHMKEYEVVETAANDSKGFYEKALAIRKATNATNTAFFESADGQNLIHNKDNHFDLLIVEAQLPAMMIFSWWYQIPFIGVSSLDCALQYHESAGNLVHPLVTPDPNLPIEDIRRPTFWDRLHSFMYINTYKALLYLLTFPKEQNMLKHYFDENVPPVADIQNNMSMLFIGTNPIFHPVRPLLPNTITIGSGLHMEEAKPLSQEIDKFLNGAKQGAIYFSLGSNVKGENLNDTTKNELLEAFASLPYRVLWKIDHEFEHLPSNIKVKKWFEAQQSILRHPNVKLFITQGGLQSMQESIYFDKPMIGIPFFGDQHMNVRRMEQFGYGLRVDKQNITKQSIREAVEEVMRNPRFMATGESYRSMSYAIRISHRYMSVIIKDVLGALRRHLVPLLLPSPSHNVLKQNSANFYRKWNFPHCVAAIDGNHVRIKCPNNNGSLFFNYKEYFSVVLLAMVDADCKFVAVDVGSYGKEGDSGIFAKSDMGELVSSGHFFPPDEELSGLGKMMPYVIIGDEAFRLHKHIMKQFTRAAARGNKEKTIFNCRLSRARRVTENAFGLLSQVFRIFNTPIAVAPETCDDLILSACCLHNLLRTAYLEQSGTPYFEYDSTKPPTVGLVSLVPLGGFANNDGFEIRQNFATYFNNQGSVEWQDRHVFRLSSI